MEGHKVISLVLFFGIFVSIEYFSWDETERREEEFSFLFGNGDNEVRNEVRNENNGNGIENLNKTKEEDIKEEKEERERIEFETLGYFLMDLIIGGLAVIVGYCIALLTNRAFLINEQVMFGNEHDYLNMNVIDCPEVECSNTTREMERIRHFKKMRYQEMDFDGLKNYEEFGFQTNVIYLNLLAEHPSSFRTNPIIRFLDDLLANSFTSSHLFSNILRV